jgi:hypothetical protein
MARSRRRDRRVQRGNTAELEALRPYLGLAREIQHEVSQVTADSGAPVESLVDAIARIPEAERARVARSVFDQLPVEEQWAVIAAAFQDDAELRAALAAEHEALRARLVADGDRHRRAVSYRAAGRIDTTTLAADETISLGLFREGDVQSVLARGRASDGAARVLTLRAEPVSPTGSPHPAGTLRVLTDAFNPDGGYFVTASYDRDTWVDEQLASHTLVRLGAIRTTDGAATGFEIEPVLYPGARVDVLRDGTGGPVEGLLHLGWATLGSEDVFGG